MKFILIDMVNYVDVWKYYINCYVNSKLAIDYTHFTQIALHFIPSLSEHDTDTLDSGMQCVHNSYVKYPEWYSYVSFAL